METLGQSIRRLSILHVEYLIRPGEMNKGDKSISRNFELILGEFFRVF
jgi:hypothetical protein